MTRVFISYSHDSDAHRDFVRGVSDRLRTDGLECLIDQYINGFPPEGWQRWMENQIEAADFVLLVCTETYLRRYRGQETEGGRGVTFEGVVISQTLYDHYYRNTKFIPLIPTHGSLEHVPLTLKPYSTYCLPSDYDKLYRVLTGQAEYIAPPLGEIRSLPAANGHTPTVIHSDRLPTVKGGFFGRSAELQLLTNAWANTTTRIIQFIAPGGTGKTKLLRHWLDHTTDIPVLIAWSFYSQGSSEDKQTSATPFFSHAFAKLGSTRERFASEEDKGDHLAELLHGKRYVLVLDGLEPLQHGGAAMRGELKDKAIRQLLRQLARHPCGLCIITTRIALHELSDRDAPTVIRHDLQNLTAADGIQLLQSLGVMGSAAELGKAVREYGGHALALSLLGNVLRLRHQGDVRKRDTLKALVKPTGNRDSRHAFKVMQAYAEWLAGEPELALLHLLGLFDHPIGQEVLHMLWDAQIPHLTAGIDEDEWLEAIASLREEHHLLSQHDGGGDLDCHPLIREYFGGQLQTQQPQAWQQAHEWLYEYYKALPEKELPDTLEEMQPLFSAVAHGCAAGLHQQALEEVYWIRIHRKSNAYITIKLGAFSDNLSVLAHLFDEQWQLLTNKISFYWQGKLLRWLSMNLYALGRLEEALKVSKKALLIYSNEKNWVDAAILASDIGELQFLLGNELTAKKSIFESKNFLEKYTVSNQNIPFSQKNWGTVTTRGNVFLSRGVFSKFDDLLNDERTVILPINQAEELLIDASLNKLANGRKFLKHGKFLSAIDNIDQAIAASRTLERRTDLSRGLLARAALHRHTHNFASARQDLQEVFDIADGSGMRLHLTDYHLEMARLLVAESLAPCPPCGGRVGEGGNSRAAADPAYHIAAAAKLIKETGYHRRDKELEELQGLSLRT
ncbi:SEFIR domain-containing protein [Thiothrix fructosivorans]|uniref:TIR and AAA domain-containing protein n=1 Tax=Thiothrix fructosivorans TaxID=111770 RepID=A0A8B0SMT7_9GAMM|nr:SEFIR domain-containing protein [Thiothrix fructosivorans]MBO0612141.1 TIR and AAA domain-containing protein [Thiothrix fructosivorans]QTX12361.1 TIR and AAA domain-containing protein [Thiothrix fructosivorans]